MKPLLLLMILLCDAAFGSYRVYKLKLEHLDEKKNLERIEFTYSTLDPTQYLYFHSGGEPIMRVTLLDTWYCPGDTGRRKYCRKPTVKPGNNGEIPYTLQPIIPQ